MYTLKYSEVALDGTQDQKRNYNDLKEKYTRLEEEHQKVIQKQCHLEAENENLKRLLKREQNKLANLLHSQNEVQPIVIGLEEKIIELNNLTKENNRIVHHYNLLCEQITHFAVETEEKQKNLPTLGNNNIEDFEVQKFLNFLTHNVEKLNLVSKGLSSPPL